MRRAPQLRMRIIIGLSSSALFASGARADRRDFVRAYQYATQPAGNLEFELWNDVLAPRAGGFKDAVLQHRLELEYGLTDHWDLALYHVFTQDPAGGFRFDSWRSETRYRLAERGEWPLDVMLYFELERPAAFALPWVTEQKLILARDLGPLQLVTNLVAEEKFLQAGDGHLWEIDLGARYELSPSFDLAGEAWTIHETVAGITTTSWFAGPSLSVATSKIWVQLGAGFGLNPGQSGSSAEVRSVLGFNL